MRMIAIATLLALACPAAAGAKTVAAAPLVSIPSHDAFFDNLRKYCGKAYEGKVAVDNPASPGFEGRLVMHVRKCTDSQLQIPFHVGENHSRTWIITKTGSGLSLKHDHRHEDGSEDRVTQYGGMATNTGSKTTQYFPADQFTVNLLPAAVSNVWWIEVVAGEYFTYNLRRIGTDRQYSIRFNLKKPIGTPPAPWGWKD